MNDLISIIIPVYNHAKELELALDFIKKQTYKNIEIIVEEDKFHEGSPKMRNIGLDKARGEYVIFWDADVVAKPEMLEKLYSALQNDSISSYSYCNYYLLTLNLGWIKIFKQILAGDYNKERLRQNNYIHSTSLIRKSDAIRWDQNLKRFQDWDLWLSMAEDGKCGVWVNEYLFKIISKGSISSWLPKFAYKKPWRYLSGIKCKVDDYERAKEIIIKKHSL